MITLKSALPLLIFCISLWQSTAAQLNVTINKKGTSTTSPVVFTAIFSAPINSATFTASDIVLSGTATGKAVNTITQVAPNDGTTFEITVTATSGDGTVIATIPAVGYVSAILANTGSGTEPYNLTMDGSGNIYTPNYGTNNVSKITPVGVSSILGTTGSGPIGITIDDLGNLYTVNVGANNVSKITPDGVSAIFGTTGIQPRGIAIDATFGMVYTCNFGSNDVSKITPEGVSSILGTTGGGPISIVWNEVSGKVYTANNGSNNISKIAPTGVSANMGTTGFDPTGMVIDGLGNLYVCNYADNNISKITPDGVSTIFSTTGTGPISINIDGLGNLYTANNIDNNVSKITPVGVSTIIGNTGAGPRGILIDGSNIYTANLRGNNVTKLTAVGIALSGSTTVSNEASTSTDNTFVLPVSLLYFTATNTYCTASLVWKTTAEINSSYYSIERSADGQVFTEIKKVASKNSAMGAVYAHTFKDVSGTVYYRLKMADADGHYVYSKILTVTANDNCNSSLQPTVSPNPANDFITVAGLVKGCHVSLINAAGTRLTGIEATSSSSQWIDISKFAKGVYVLHIEATDGSIQTVKFIK